MVSVNTNYSALLALQQLSQTREQLEISQNRLSTGLDINSAKDDGAIYAMALEIRSDVAGIGVVGQSLERAISVVDLAIAAGEAISDVLLELKDISLAASDDSLTTDARAALDEEFTALRDQISTLVATAEIGGVNLIDGSIPEGISALANVQGTHEIRISGFDFRMGGQSATIPTPKIGGAPSENSVSKRAESKTELFSSISKSDAQSRLPEYGSASASATAPTAVQAGGTFSASANTPTKIQPGGAEKTLSASATAPTAVQAGGTLSASALLSSASAVASTAKKTLSASALLSSASAIASIAEKTLSASATSPTKIQPSALSASALLSSASAVASTAEKTLSASALLSSASAIASIAEKTLSASATSPTKIQPGGAEKTLSASANTPTKIQPGGAEKTLTASANTPTKIQPGGAKKTLSTSATSSTTAQSGGATVTLSASARLSSASVAKATVQTLDTSIKNVSRALGKLSAGAKVLDSQHSFVVRKADILTAAVGNLVDADIGRESARIKSLQTKYALGAQVLAIANSTPSLAISLLLPANSARFEL